MQGATAISLSVQDNELVEGDRTRIFTGTAPGASDLTNTPTATLTIVDNDQAPTRLLLQVAPDRVGEGSAPQDIEVTANFNAGSGLLPNAVELMVAVAGGPVTVDGTATEPATDGTDFTSVSDLVLTIPPRGRTATATFRMEPIEDVMAEPEETIVANGLSATAASVESAMIVLVDNDFITTGVHLKVAPTNVAEGDGDVNITVIAALLPESSAPRLTPLDVTVVLGIGTATPAVDFSGFTTGTVQIPMGATSGSASFPLTVVDDNIVELSAETVVFIGQSTEFADTDGVALTIDDDERPPEIVIALQPTRLMESSGLVPIAMSAKFSDNGSDVVLPVDTRVTFSIEGGTATVDKDFAAVPDFELQIMAGTSAARRSFILMSLDDRMVESDEMLVVRAQATDSADVPTTVTIIDNDFPPSTPTPDITMDGEFTADDALIM